MRSDKTNSIGSVIQKGRKDRGLTQDQLARLAEVPYTTLTKVESGKIKSPSAQFVYKISKALGMSSDSLLVPDTFHGDDSLEMLWSDILATLSLPGQSMYMSGVKESDYIDANSKHLKKFIKELKLRGLKQKLIVAESDTEFLEGDHLEYRCIPDRYFNSTPIYVYGKKIAILVWGPPRQVVIFESEVLADTFLKQFLFIWDKAKPVKNRVK